MTSRYSDMNQHDALYKTACAYPGGLEALAHRMGRSVNVLRNKLRPAIDTHHTSFEEVSEVLEICEDGGVKDCFQSLHAFNHRHGHVAFPVMATDHLTDQELSQTMGRVMMEVGEVAAKILECDADNSISDGDLEKIEKEFQEAMGALGEWRDRVRAKHAAGKKKQGGAV